jgi:hypothetical protein
VTEAVRVHRWRGPLLLVGAMFGWMVVVFILAGSSGGGSVPTPATETLGQGVTVTPADGWTSAENAWDVGPNAISLKKSGVLVAFAADAYEGTTQQLFDDQLAGAREQFGSFRTLPEASGTLAEGVPALSVLFSGTADSSDLEGQLVVAATGQTGVVMLAVAPAGQIARVQGDLDEMLASLVIPR